MKNLTIGNRSRKISKLKCQQQRLGIVGIFLQQAWPMKHRREIQSRSSIYHGLQVAKGITQLIKQLKFRGL